MPRIFEMRTYVAHEGKFAALLDRFRRHTLRLFEKHGMTNLGYWVPQGGESAEAPDTIVYLLAHPSREAADRSWAAFRSDPGWVRIRDASEMEGKLVKKILTVFLEPTDFSPLQ